jgi:hypothetical protein
MKYIKVTKIDGIAYQIFDKDNWCLFSSRNKETADAEWLKYKEALLNKFVETKEVIDEVDERN